MQKFSIPKNILYNLDFICQTINYCLFVHWQILVKCAHSPDTGAESTCPQLTPCSWRQAGKQGDGLLKASLFNGGLRRPAVKRH